jgi:hypothetical protein
VRIGGLVINEGRGSSRRGRRFAIGLVVFLVMLVALVAPAAFLTGLILAVIGHWLAGVLMILGSFVIGVGGTMAILATGMTALRRAGQQSVLRLGRRDYQASDEDRSWHDHDDH